MKDRITVFSINITIKVPLRVFAFRHPVVSQLKAEVNGKNCTPLRFVAFALCARLLLKTLIIPRVRLAIEFGSFFIYATILSFFVDFRATDDKIKNFYLFPVLLRFCRKANKNGGIKCCIQFDNSSMIKSEVIAGVFRRNDLHNRAVG